MMALLVKKLSYLCGILAYSISLAGEEELGLNLACFLKCRSKQGGVVQPPPVSGRSLQNWGIHAHTK